MTLADFFAQFPEFSSLNAQQVTRAFAERMLDAARLEINYPRWGAMAEQGVAYLAAHKLAVSPWGNNTKLAAGDGTTTYLREFQRMAGSIGSGGLVL